MIKSFVLLLATSYVSAVPNISIGGDDDYPTFSPYSEPHGDVSDYASSKCSKSSDGSLDGAAEQVSEYCAYNGRISNHLLRSALSGIPFQKCAVHCIRTNKSEHDAVDALINHSSKVCRYNVIGAAHVQTCLCIFSCNMKGDYDPVYQPPRRKHQNDYPPTRPSRREPKQIPTGPSRAPSSGGGGGGFESECIRKTNEYRRRQGVPDLTFDSGASAVARKQCQCMVSKNVLSHSACQSFQSRIGSSGASDGASAENIGYRTGLGDDSAGADQAVQDFEDSPGHAKNMRNPKVTAMGCAIIPGSGGEPSYFTQVFVEKRSGGGEY